MNSLQEFVDKATPQLNSLLELLKEAHKNKITILLCGHSYDEPGADAVELRAPFGDFHTVQFTTDITKVSKL